MEPLPPATLAGLTSPDGEVRFHDDRMEAIPFDEPTDLVAISVETYTARRAYQIASEYRRRGVPVVMGGFHATLVPEEVIALLRGRSSSGRWRACGRRVLEDAAAGRLQRVYRGEGRPGLAGLRPDRSIFAGKQLPAHRAGRGRARVPLQVRVLRRHVVLRRDADPAAGGGRAPRGPRGHRGGPEAALLRRRQHHVEHGRGQGAVPGAPARKGSLGQPGEHRRGPRRGVPHGCSPRAAARACSSGSRRSTRRTWKQMRKRFNTMRGGYAKALENLRRHGVRLYATFVVGYDQDTEASVDADVAVRARPQVLHRRLQPSDAVPRHAALRPLGGRGPAPLRRRGGWTRPIVTTRSRSGPPGCRPSRCARRASRLVPSSTAGARSRDGASTG